MSSGSAVYPNIDNYANFGDSKRKADYRDDTAGNDGNSNVDGGTKDDDGGDSNDNGRDGNDKNADEKMRITMDLLNL